MSFSFQYITRINATIPGFTVFQNANYWDLIVKRKKKITSKTFFSLNSFPFIFLVTVFLGQLGFVCPTCAALSSFEDSASLKRAVCPDPGAVSNRVMKKCCSAKSYKGCRLEMPNKKSDRQDREGKKGRSEKRKLKKWVTAQIKHT